METLRVFFRQRALWLGFVLVIIPLLLILWLQYRSLRSLERTLPAWRKEELKNFLRDVAKESEAYYRKMADQALSVQASAIANRIDGVIAVGGGREEILNHVDRVGEHFSRQSLVGIKRYFLIAAASRETRVFTAIMFYDPERRALKLDPSAPEWFPIHLASAPYSLRITNMQGASPESVAIEQPPDHRFILKPILDSSGKIVGMAGMAIDQQHFRETVLRDAIAKAGANHFPQAERDLVLTLRDSENRLLLSTQPESAAAPEAQVNFDYLFRDWALGVRMRGLSEAQVARRVFLLNITLSALMAVLAVAGLSLAIRTAMREVKLSQMKSDFVSNVSHELRTPLTSIRGLGEFLRLGRVSDAEKMRKYGEYIENESRRLTQLINNILDFSRIESGGKEYRFVRADIGAIVADTLYSFDVRLKQEGFVVRLEGAAGSLPPVLADSEAIAQAFINLLDNAVKYSGDAREIKVKLEKQGDEAIIAVMDYGIGIARESHARIFEKFYRTEGGLVHNIKGSGLGLTIVRHIVEAHGGRVCVESEAGRGSTFTIRLPIAEPNRSSNDPPAADPAATRVGDFLTESHNERATR